MYIYYLFSIYSKSYRYIYIIEYFKLLNEKEYIIFFYKTSLNNLLLNKVSYLVHLKYTMLSY